MKQLNLEIFAERLKRGDVMAGEKFTIYMDSDLKKRLKKRAIDEERSSSVIISELVEEYLKHKKEPNI